LSNRDWSSDVCSSDLIRPDAARLAAVIESDDRRSALGLQLTAYSSALFDRGFRGQQLGIVSHGRELLAVGC
jgi:hypothetical protein